MHTSRLGLRAGAVIGAASLAVLAAAPAFAADPDSQATAQSLNLTIAGQSAISQLVTATNDGTTESKNDASTIPTIAGVLPGNNALGAGVAPQDAGANADGTSWACAGIAGTGGGIVHTGNSSCNINGAPITLNLGTLNLGNIALDPASALGAAIAQTPLGGALDTVITQLQNDLISQVTQALASTPLSATLGGTLSAIEGTCQATPTGATGAAHLVDSQGGSANTPIKLNIAGQSLTLLDLPANPPANTHLVTNLSTVVSTIETALSTELDNAVGGALGPVNTLLTGTLLPQLHQALLNQLLSQLETALKPLQDNVLDVTLNKQVASDGGRKLDVTALDLQVLPAAAAFTGSSLISGQLGHVTCGPNAGRVAAAPQAATAAPHHGNNSGDTGGGSGDVPTAVDAGLSGDQHSHTALYAGLGGLVAAGAAGTAFAYRRFALK